MLGLGSWQRVDRGISGQSEEVRVGPQLEHEEHAIHREEDEGETSRHLEEIVEFRSFRGCGSRSNSLADDILGRGVGIMVRRGEHNRGELREVSIRPCDTVGDSL